ncbi:hypothetical protein CFP65_7624 [Kitasatospora sp. MMS16-BH015]|uniref:hypothetical protein n=1 Tax=Kitasatospora sp. MMS16-BH015 TaxID=2018025 RepID=UPI000CA2636E|nr:hypothetical protein [Kitasatospora sp. MMS16-BH015]AUG82195.1 hypothetical protein CFP65_7624 [Kitasatospora sp. MMS16-BH015]
MHPHLPDGDPHLSRWLRVREFAVPPTMIETATARRLAGDWGGACAAARFDLDLDLRTVAREHGRQLAAQVRSDLRVLAPDLLRWHLPRTAPDGRLRPGLSISLARYQLAERPRGRPESAYLVARTPPAWADAGQRVSLALRTPDSARQRFGRYPHPKPSRRFRLDLHRHLWDAGRSGELASRAGVLEPAENCGLPPGLAVDRWAEEAALLLSAEGRTDGTVAVRLGTRSHLTLRHGQIQPGVEPGAAPVLPEAATWRLPDLDLLHHGLIRPDRLHPLVAAALCPDRSAPGTAHPSDRPAAWLVECRGATHRIDLVDGALAVLDHAPEELHREELLLALGGPPLPCLQAIDQAHRHPEDLDAVRARLDHGDAAGALALVETLLGPAAVLRAGPLRDELDTAVHRKLVHGLFRAGLTSHTPYQVCPRTLRRPSRRTPRG